MSPKFYRPSSDSSLRDLISERSQKLTQREAPQGAAMRSTPLAMLGLRPARGSAPLRGVRAGQGLTAPLFVASRKASGRGASRSDFDGLRRVEQRAIGE